MRLQAGRRHAANFYIYIFPTLLVGVERIYIGSGLRRDHEIQKAIFAKLLPEVEINVQSYTDVHRYKLVSSPTAL